MQRNWTPASRPSRPINAACSTRCGATIVEFAVVAPLLFFMILLYIEFDRYLLTVHAMKEAARVGCRVAILEGSTLEEVETEVSDMLTPFSVDKYTVNVTPSLTTAIEAGAPVSVNIDVKYDDVAWLPSPELLGGKTISVTSTLPKEK